MASKNTAQGNGAHNPSSPLVQIDRNRQRISRSLSRSPHRHQRPGSLQQHISSHRLSPETGSSDHVSSWTWTRLQSSESGTEADDEGPANLKSLSVAQSCTGRINKEQNGIDWAGAYDSDKMATRRMSSVRGNMRDTVDGVRVTKKGRRRRKRGIEVLRRVCETFLILSVGLTVLLPSDSRMVAEAWKRGRSSYLPNACLLYLIVV
jgi:hypothetical protein